MRPASGNADAPMQCRYDRIHPTVWGYNEVGSSSASKSADLANIAKCPKYAQRTTLGTIYYAFDVPRQHWETSGHIPSGIGAYEKFLELYGGRVGGHDDDVTTSDAYGKWKSTWRLTQHGKFWAMVNFAGTDGNARSAVYNVCHYTWSNGYVGLYGGSNEKTNLESSTRLRDVAAGLNDCTKKT